MKACNFGVNWYIMDSVLPITSAQLSAFNSYFTNNLTFAGGKGNARGEQSANGRAVL